MKIPTDSFDTDTLGRKMPVFNVPVLAIPALVLVMLAFMAVYTIESGNVGVLSTFGKYDPEEKEPGLHLKLPFVQTVKVFDVRLQTVNYKSAKDLPDQGGVINKPAIEVLDNKNLPIGVELTVQFTPDKKEAYNHQIPQKALGHFSPIQDSKTGRKNTRNSSKNVYIISQGLTVRGNTINHGAHSQIVVFER